MVHIAVNNKRRGKQLERDIVKKAQEAGLIAKRAWGSDGRAMGHHQEVDVLIEDQKIQCKRMKKLSEKIRPNVETVDMQIIRQDNDQAFVVMPLKLLLSLLLIRKNQNNASSKS